MSGNTAATAASKTKSLRRPARLNKVSVLIVGKPLKPRRQPAAAHLDKGEGPDQQGHNAGDV